MHFLPTTATEKRELVKRAGAELLMGLSAAFFIHSILQTPPAPEPTHVALSSLSGQEDAYTLPVKYDGLSVFENIDDGNVLLFNNPYDRHPAYEFHIRLQIVIAGERMFDVEGPYIPADLKRDYYDVQKRFCERHAGMADLMQGRFEAYCSPPPAKAAP